jgi:hypothetical protein
MERFVKRHASRVLGSISGFDRGWRIPCLLCMRPTKPGNISVTASYPWPVLACVAPALLPVRYAWNASAPAQADGSADLLFRSAALSPVFSPESVVPKRWPDGPFKGASFFS